MNWNETVALVTGASRGLGQAIAERLAAEGALVIGTATGEAGARAIDERLAGAPRPGRGRVLDVTDGAACEALVRSIDAEFGAPLVLVNNAGITRDGLLLRMKEADWDAVLNTNLSAVYRMSKACLFAMIRARYGRIVNIASVVAAMGNPGQANYVAAKAGMIGLTKSLAREVASRGITVNAIAPGFIDTDMTRALPEAQRAALLGAIPAGRFGVPEDIAAAVAFLAGPEAAYITGTTLHVNGGMYLA